MLCMQMNKTVGVFSHIVLHFLSPSHLLEFELFHSAHKKINKSCLSLEQCKIKGVWSVQNKTEKPKRYKVSMSVRDIY